MSWPGSVKRGIFFRSLFHSDAWAIAQFGTLVEPWTIRFPGSYEGYQTLFRESYIIHTAKSKQSLGLLLNGDEKTFSLHFSTFGGLAHQSAGPVHSALTHRMRTCTYNFLRRFIMHYSPAALARQAARVITSCSLTSRGRIYSLSRAEVSESFSTFHSNSETK